MRKVSSKAFYKNRNILVTGGLGFIGSALVEKLVGYGSKVTVVDSLIPDYGGNLFNVEGVKKRITVNISDVRDRYSMNYLTQGKDILFNLAGTLSHIDSMRDPFTDLEINITSQLSILEACRQNNPKIKIVYAGTRNQYGRAKYLPVDEKHPLEPIDVNGVNCNAGEYYHILYNNVYGIQSCSLRLTNTFGPRHQMRHPRQGVLNWFLRQLIDGEKIKLFGTGKQIRDVNYVDDVVDAFLLVGVSNKVWGEVYNLGGTSISLEDFVKTAIKIYGKGSFEVVPFPDERRNIEVGDYVANYRKITKATGWRPETSLESGIVKTIKFYAKFKRHYW